MYHALILFLLFIIVSISIFDITVGILKYIQGLVL